MPGAAWLEQLSAAQKKWAETVTEMLNKHRETLDAQYKAGIRTIEEAFKVGEAKDPAAVPPADRGAVEAELRVSQHRGRVADARRPGRRCRSATKSRPRAAAGMKD